MASEGSGARGEDCILQTEVISESCFETVNSSVCANNDRDTVLFGQETKTMAIEYPGTNNGIGCEDIIKRNLEQSNLNVPEVFCNDLGLCTVVRKWLVSLFSSIM